MWNYLFSLQKEEWKGREKNTEHCFIFPLMWKSERKSGSEMFRSGSPVEQHYCLSQRCRLEQRHIHLLLLKDLKNGGLLCLLSSLETEESELFSCIEQRPELVCHSVSFSLLLISNVLSVDPQVIRTWQVMSVTRCCVQNFPVRLFSCLVCQLSVLNYFCLVWWDFLSDLEGFVYYIYM